jgi:serine/threonine protein phosphatase 1
MTDQVAFVGDIHGNVSALEGIRRQIASHSIPKIVFLGDYVNKGTGSRGVLDCLLEARNRDNATLLRGNHERELLLAIASTNLTGFLKMGGSQTIRSYVNGSVRPDVLAHFLEELPQSHLELLKSLELKFETDDIIAEHEPGESNKFHISAHRPVGVKPLITSGAASIDTGCGADTDGRLTAFLWPSRNYMQVDNSGRLI